MVPGVAASRLFADVLCAVDLSTESAPAVRQVGRLAPAGSQVRLLHAHPPPYGPAALGPAVLRHARLELEAELAPFRAELPAELVDTPLELVIGIPSEAVVEASQAPGVSLLAVGSHGHGRAAGALIGSVATYALHRAACSVLVAREPAERSSWPRRVVAGCDGSAISLSAVDVARDLAERTGAELLVILAHGGKGIESGAARHAVEARIGASPLEDERDAVDALLAQDADLIVIGSRGAHGVAALGSVSERVGHRAACSVLILRPRHA